MEDDHAGDGEEGDAVDGVEDDDVHDLLRSVCFVFVNQLLFRFFDTRWPVAL